MKKSLITLAATALFATSGAFAQVTGSLGGLDTSANFLALSGANVTGGAIYLDSENFPGYAARPTNIAPSIVTVGNWLAVGPNNGSGTATLALPGKTKYVSFLWGSPDIYNALTVNTSNGGSSSFAASTLGILPTQNQRQATYANFVPNGAYSITSLVFSSPKTNAFEISNVTAVPEPRTYALMLAGLAAIAFAARQNRRNSSLPASGAL